MQDPYYDRSEVSNSDLGALKDKLRGSVLHDPSEAYAFGSLVDALITEPARIDILHKEFDGKKVKNFDMAYKMAKIFLNDDVCKNLIIGADFQKVSVKRRALKYNNIPFELNCRCKWDIFSKYIAGDIKTTTATTQKGFEAACSFFDYDRQRAWYMDMEDRDRDILVGISKVNFKIFYKRIQRNDDFYNSGKEKYLDLAFKYWIIN